MVGRVGAIDSKNHAVGTVHDGRLDNGPTTTRSHLLIAWVDAGLRRARTSAAVHFPDETQPSRAVADEDVSRDAIVNRAGENRSCVNRDRPTRCHFGWRALEYAREFVNAAAVVADVYGVRAVVIVRC